MAIIGLKVSPAYGISCDVSIHFINVTRFMRGVADEDKGNKSRQFQFKVGEIMDKQDTKLAIKLALIDLIHNMNRDTTLKLNLIIICVQFTMLFISLILQVAIPERKLGASIMNSIWSTAMLFLVIINIKIVSTKAMKKAREQKDMIEVLLDRLTKEDNTNEQDK